MIAPRLVRLIETHSEELTRGLLDRLQRSGRFPDFQKIPKPELRHRVREIYQHLSDWLLTKTQSEIEQRFLQIGARRAHQGVALSQVILAALTVKEHLWDFVKREGLVDRPVEIFQELELFQLIDQFFDRSVYFLALGYEQGLAGCGGQDTSTRAA